MGGSDDIMDLKTFVGPDKKTEKSANTARIDGELVEWSNMLNGGSHGHCFASCI